jgi:chlorite dismutase
MPARLFTFLGGPTGPWRVETITAVSGESLPAVANLDVIPGSLAEPKSETQWALRGITGNERYVTRDEQRALVSIQPPLERPQAICAALIPIRKTPAWWGLSQQERREVFEEQSNHVRTGLRYLPAIARRLHHCRDLGENEPFDFLTWFEFAPDDTGAFAELVDLLRSSREWDYVEREVDIRVTRGTR